MPGSRLLQAVAGHVLAALIDEARPILQRYRDHKRASALLDFDDLIFAARDLLRDHDDVRRALGQRFAHVLVDEFQDTDPLQTEIFWRLCGEPGRWRQTTGPRSASGRARSSWSAIPSRRSIASAAPTSAPMCRRATPSAPRIPAASCRSPPISAPAPDPHLRQRALRGRALGRWAAGLHRSRSVS